ncbi:hypothetical protein BsWGS_08255 [Bradybaena similaris]
MSVFNLFIVLSQLLGLCLSAGVVEINLVSFYNNEGKRRDGQCCDPADSIWSWSWSWFTKNEEDKCKNCNHVFSFCLGNDTESSSMMSCEYGRKRTDQINQNQITFGRDAGGIKNPLKFSFDSWPGLVKLKLDILDEDDPGSFDFIDHIDFQYSSSDVKRHNEARVQKLHLGGSITEINLELRVYCAPSFFGYDCSEHCQARDDERGHYVCNPVTGDKICLFGWIGPDCQTNFDDCAGNRCHGGATCLDQVGYYTCKCPPGRTGVYCDGEINECASSPCQNMGVCKDHLNGFICECSEEWTGVFCEIEHIACVSDLCVYGFCTRRDGQDVCVCKDGYHGQVCDNAVASCADQPCKHMSVCQDIPTGYRCACVAGFTGKETCLCARISLQAIDVPVWLVSLVRKHVCVPGYSYRL